MKTILMVAGGTLGHINPALSFIKAIKNYDSTIKIIFFATKKDLKFEILKNNPLINEIYYFDVVGVPTNKIYILKNLIKNLKEIKTISKTLESLNINCCIGMGGYISGIVINICNKYKIPTIIHEQNSIIGLANKMVLSKVNLILTSFENTIIKNKYKNKTHFIGNPRYDEVNNFRYRNYQNKNNILITSGSLGSKVINEKAIDFLNSEESKNYYTIVVTGTKYYQSTLKNIKQGSHYKIIDFTDNLIKYISNASIIISRAGSSTISEILSTKSVAIIIPSPNVAKNHQYYNAKVYSQQKLIMMVEEKYLINNNLNIYINEITNKYDYYKKNLNQYNLGSVTKRFIDLIKPYIERGLNND